MPDATAGRPPLTMPGLAMALAAILALALVLPYVAVRRMHQGRVDAADRQAAAIAHMVDDVMRASPDSLPSSVELLEGPGARPAIVDERWTNAKSLPLARVLRGTPVTADPWGNAYLVIARSSASRPEIWVVTAGPDGIVQTLFPAPASAPVSAADDRLFRVQ
jgi:hypothetical protein